MLGMMHTQMGVNPLDVAFHLRYSVPPLTATATAAAPSMFPSVPHRSGAGFDPHSHVRLYFALRFLDGIGRGRPDHPLISLGPDLCNFRGLDAAGGHHHLSRTDVHFEYQLVQRLALFPVSQKAHQHFEDNLDRW
jgi:hypothetical protein